MTEQTRRTFAKPATELHYARLGSRVAVDKVGETEIFLPIIESQLYEATLPNGVKVQGRLSVVQAAINGGTQ